MLEPIDDLEDKDFYFWLDVTCDLLCLEDLEKRILKYERYVVVRNKWRYSYRRKK